MADNNNTTEHVVRISADTSSMDESLDRSSDRLSRFEAITRRASEFISSMWTNMSRNIDRSTEDLAEFNEELDDIGGGFNNFNMNKIQSEIDKTTRRLDSLLARRDKMQFMGTDVTSNAFRSLAYDIAQAREELQSLNLSLSDELEQGIEHVRADMERIAQTEAPTEGYRELQKAADKAEQTLLRLLNRQEEMEAVGVSENSQAWRRLQIQIDAADENLARYERHMDSMRSRGTAFTSGVNTQEYAEAEALLRNYTERLEAAQSETSEYVADSVSQYSAGFNNIIRGSQKVANNITKNIGRNLKNSFKNVERVVHSLISRFRSLTKETNSVRKAVDKMSKNITSVFTQLRFRIKEMLLTAVFQDIRDNFNRLAEISPRFNKSLSSMIDSMRALGAQIVATLEPALAAIGPLVTSITDKLTQAADSVSQFVARLAGSDTYVKATKQQSDYAKSLQNAEGNANRATKAVNAYKNSVLGFDQLNKMSDNDNGLGVDVAQLDSVLTKSSAMNELADNLRTALVTGDFEDFGDTVADVVNRAFGWLDKTIGWRKNAEKFTKTLQNVVKGINGFVSGLNPRAIGSAIAETVNTIIESFKLLTDPAKGINFGNIGFVLGTALITAFAGINWHSLGASIVQSIQGGIAIINGLFTASITDAVTGQELTVGTVIGQSLNAMFSGALDALDPTAWGNMIANVVNNLTDFITATFADTSNVVKLAESMAISLNTAIGNINAEQLSSAIMALVDTFLDFFGTMFNSIDWNAVWDLLSSTLSSQNIDWMKIINAIGLAALPSLIVTTLTTGLSSLGSVIASSAATIASSPVVLTAVAGAFGVAGAAYGIDAIAQSLPTVVDNTKQLFEGEGSGSLKTLNEMGAEFDHFGGNFGAAMATYLDTSKVLTDTNNAFVSFAGTIISSQDYVDMVYGSLDGLVQDIDGDTHLLNDEMRALADQLVAQGHAVDNTADMMSSRFAPELWATSDDLAKFSTGLDNATAKLNSLQVNTSTPDYSWMLAPESIPHFANGGVVGDGQLFIANEGGVAELITKDGAGNTAIVNNDQIISAVVSGVRQAMLEASYNIADKIADSSSAGGDIVLNVDSVELARATARGQRQIDRRGNHSVSFA